MIDERTRKTILGFQKNEITEHRVYEILARKTKGRNAEVLRRISEDELRHYNQWKKYTKTEVSRNRLAVLKYLIVSKIFGLTFTMKMMESGEEKAQKAYTKILTGILGGDPEVKEIVEDEFEHEKSLVGMIDEERIGYVGSMVLGLNDALVELTGALAGLTFALERTLVVGVAGLITGIAASLSMAASEYLSKKSEGAKNPIKASLYTGIAYILTVLILVLPYFVFSAYYVAFGATLLAVLLIILVFTFFVSVVKDLSFKRTFLEMIVMSLGVAAVSFIIGSIAGKFLA